MFFFLGSPFYPHAFIHVTAEKNRGVGFDQSATSYLFNGEFVTNVGKMQSGEDKMRLEQVSSSRVGGFSTGSSTVVMSVRNISFKVSEMVSVLPW